MAPEDLFNGPIFLRKGANQYSVKKVVAKWKFLVARLSMKDPCVTREQPVGIHNVVNDQGFAIHSRDVSYTVVFRFERINTAKQKDGLTS